MADPLEDYLARWRSVVDTLTWTRPWTEIYRPDPPYGDWFVDGRMNLAADCLDRHLPQRGEQVAIFWEGEPGDRRELTYRVLRE